MHPIHSIMMGNVLGVSVSTAVVICHTSVTVSVTGSNLVARNLPQINRGVSRETKPKL